MGWNLAKHLCDIGEEVILPLRPGKTYWRIDISLPQIHKVTWDGIDSTTITDLILKYKPSTIIHCAAHGAYQNQTSLSTMINSNIKMLVTIIEACKRLPPKHFITTGSSSEYGELNNGPKETDPTNPNSLYAITKRTATDIAQRSVEEFGFPITTARLYSVYGPFEEPSRLMPTLIVAAQSNNWPPLANPETVRDFVYIDDVITAYDHILERSFSTSEIFNIGTSVETSLRGLIDTAQKVFEVKAEPQWASYPDRQWETRHWMANSEKARKILDWNYQISLSNGLKKFGEWLSLTREQFNYYGR